MIFPGRALLAIATEYAKNNYRKLLDMDERISDIDGKIVKKLKPKKCVNPKGGNDAQTSY